MRNIILTMVVLCVGCDIPQSEKSRRAGYIMQTLTYSQDPRTGLCFAVSAAGLTNVPCENVKNFFTHVEKNTCPSPTRTGPIGSDCAMYKMR